MFSQGHFPRDGEKATDVGRDRSTRDDKTEISLCTQNFMALQLVPLIKYIYYSMSHSEILSKN